MKEAKLKMLRTLSFQQYDILKKAKLGDSEKNSGSWGFGGGRQRQIGGAQRIFQGSVTIPYDTVMVDT